jgi:hypothetical protein
MMEAGLDIGVGQLVHGRLAAPLFGQHSGIGQPLVARFLTDLGL